MLSDVRHAIRLLIKDRSFTVTALVTLALKYAVEQRVKDQKRDATGRSE